MCNNGALEGVALLTTNDETTRLALMMSSNLQGLNKNLLVGELREHEPMSKHTTWKTGGAADLYFVPASLDDLSSFLKMLPTSIQVTWVGKGSNLLIRDGGIDGAVVSVDGVLDSFELQTETEIETGAGLP